MAREYVECSVCHNTRREYASGMCSGCYRRERSKTDPDYAKRVKDTKRKSNKEYRKRRRAEDPGYDRAMSLEEVKSAAASNAEKARLYDEMKPKLDALFDRWSERPDLDSLSDVLEHMNSELERYGRITQRYYKLALKVGNGTLPADYSID